MDAQKAKAERRELFDNVYAFKPTKYLPTHGGIWTWKYLDQGLNLKDVLFDYPTIEKANREFLELYQFDSVHDMGTRNPMRVSSALGVLFHYINDAGDAVLIDDRCIVKREEYQEMRENLDSLYWTKAFMRSCKPGITIGELKNAIQEYLDYRAWSARMAQIRLDEYGVFSVSGGMTQMPFEALFNGLRGIKELSLDLRKCKDEMKAAMEAMFEREVKPALDIAMTKTYTGSIADIGTTLLGHSVLSVQQFEELYWPHLKYLLDSAIKNKKTIHIFSESTMMRFTEFFQDIPRGVLCIHPEQDDVLELRKKLPNAAIAGGMLTSLLGMGTREECVNYAKKLADSMGAGFILSQDKMISYRNDIKRENLLAVQEFARNYH